MNCKGITVREETSNRYKTDKTCSIFPLIDYSQNLDMNFQKMQQIPGAQNNKVKNNNNLSNVIKRFVGLKKIVLYVP